MSDENNTVVEEQTQDESSVLSGVTSDTDENQTKDESVLSNVSEGDKEVEEVKDDVTETVNYEKELTLPENLDVETEEGKASFNGFVDLLDTTKVSAEDAQKILNYYGETTQANNKLYEETFSSWKKEIEEDKEIGGTNLKSKTIPNVKRAVSKYGDKELSALLDSPVYGNNITVVRFLNRIGESLKEGGYTKGSATSRVVEEDLYPNSNY